MDEKLIEKVREHEVIYNVGLPEYRDQHIRQNAWEEIAGELNISANQAKEHWDKLRRCFCNARNRRRDEQKSGMAYKKKPLWKYEQQMEFLIPFMESRKIHSNLNKSQACNLSTDTDDISAYWVDTEETINSQMQGEEANLDADNDYSGQSSQVALEDAASNDRRNNARSFEALKTLQNKYRKKFKHSPIYQVVRPLQENSDLRKRKYEEKISPAPSTTFDGLDEIDMFFLSMSRMTKQLPKVDQAQIKLSLSNLVMSAEIRNQQQISHNLPQVQHSLQEVKPSCSSFPSPNSAGQ